LLRDAPELNPVEGIFEHPPRPKTTTFVGFFSIRRQARIALQGLMRHSPLGGKPQGLRARKKGSVEFFRQLRRGDACAMAANRKVCSPSKNWSIRADD
jgi:hypothetical protein